MKPTRWKRRDRAWIVYTPFSSDKAKARRQERRERQREANEEIVEETR